jgi:hypothetical protein
MVIEELLHLMKDRKQRLRKGLEARYKTFKGTPSVTYFLQLGNTC